MSAFTFDAKAALKRARETRGHPTFPTLPTREAPEGRKVGSVGSVGRVRALAEKSAGPPAPAAEAVGSFPTEGRAPDAPVGGGICLSPHPAASSGTPPPSPTSPPLDWPRTWTGRIVSPEEWAGLSDWEKRGPDGRVWCGICRVWHLPGGCLTDPDGVARTPEAIEAIWCAAERMAPAIRAEREGG